MRRVRVIVGVCALLAACAAPPAFAGTLDTLTDAQIAARFAPRLVLHADERYAPTSTDELLTLGATLVNRSGGLVRAAPLTPALLPVGSSCVGGLPCAYALRLGCGLSASTPCPAPADSPRLMYARVVRRHPPAGHRSRVADDARCAHALSRARGRRPVLALLPRRRLALHAAQRQRARRGHGAAAGDQPASRGRLGGGHGRACPRTGRCSSTGAPTAPASGDRSRARPWSPTPAARARTPCPGWRWARTPTCRRP